MRRPSFSATPLALAMLVLSLHHPGTALAQSSAMDLLNRFLPPGNKAAPRGAATEGNATESAAPGTAAPSATPAAAKPEPPAAAPATVTAPAAPAAQIVVPNTTNCRPLTDQAMEADVKSSTALQQKADLNEQARLLDATIALWTQAVVGCDGRAKDRAQRNLSESLRVRSELQEQLGADPQCAAAQKNATSFQDMARQAQSDRRWAEAASLYRKAEDQWDIAGERCSGMAQEVAQRRREQAEIDAHNADFCAPMFDRAREVSQRARSLAPGLTRDEKQEALQLSETLWRDAIALCKGPAQDTARSNAAAIARERGSPWQETRQALSLGNLGNPSLTNLSSLPLPNAPRPVQVNSNTPATAPRPVTGSAVQQAEGTAQASGTAANTASRAAQTVATSAGAAGSAGTVVTTAATAATSVTTSAAAAQASTLANSASAAATTAVAVSTAAQAGTALLTKTTSAALGKAMPAEFSAGNTKFNGKFSLDASGNSYSGQGRVLWGNGDIYDGTLVANQRHGQGRMVWANGQRYDGDWFQDKPTGKASVQYPNGNTYNGAVIEGVPNGQGRMTYASGDIYVGEFKGGYPEGKGTQTWPNGQRYEGEWFNRQPNGQGRLQFASGEIYTGQLVNGQPQGQGTFTWPTGDQYQGQWQQGKKHGQGTFTWKSGDRWEGVYDNDQQTAQGKFIPK